jgi:hypothetical protein
MTRDKRRKRNKKQESESEIGKMPNKIKQETEPYEEKPPRASWHCGELGVMIYLSASGWDWHVSATADRRMFSIFLRWQWPSGHTCGVMRS